MQTFELLGVRVGRPRVLGTYRGRTIVSSFHRRLVTVPAIRLTETGLEGDEPADTRPNDKGGQMHGGPDKAVYAYPWCHYDRWRDELGSQVLGSHSFGENLVLLGINEDNVRIGDVWSWGKALLEVTKPRTPCVTLDYVFGNPRPSMIRRMWANGYCGWYLRVVTPGVVPTTGFVHVVSSQPEAPTVAEVFAMKAQRKSTEGNSD